MEFLWALNPSSVKRVSTLDLDEIYTHLRSFFLSTFSSLISSLIPFLKPFGTCIKPPYIVDATKHSNEAYNNLLNAP